MSFFGRPPLVDEVRHQRTPQIAEFKEIRRVHLKHAERRVAVEVGEALAQLWLRQRPQPVRFSVRRRRVADQQRLARRGHGADLGRVRVAGHVEPRDIVDGRVVDRVDGWAGAVSFPADYHAATGQRAVGEGTEINQIHSTE